MSLNNVSDLLANPYISEESKILNIYMDEIRNYPLLTMEEEKELFEAYAQTKDSMIVDKIVRGNLRHVAKIANQYRNLGVSYIELIQEGNIGLLKAIERYDVTKGYRFSTYSFYWIRQAVVGAIQKYSRPVNLYTSKNNRFSQYIQTKQQLFQELEREPSREELCERLPFPKKFAMEYLIECERISKDTISLHKAAYEDGEEYLKYLIDSNVDVEEEALQSVYYEPLYEALERLTPKERSILLLHYGMVDGKEKGHEAIAKILFQQGITDRCLSHQRISQLEEKALEKIRSDKNLKRAYKPTEYEIPPHHTVVKDGVRINETTTFGEFVSCVSKLSLDDVELLLSRLTPIQKQVLVLHYGIYDGFIRTWLRIGVELFEQDYTAHVLPMDRLQEIEAFALQKLEPYGLPESLKEFYQRKLKVMRALETDISLEEQKKLCK